MRNGIFAVMMFLVGLMFVYPKTVQAQDTHLPRLLRRDVPCGSGMCDQFRMGDSTQITYLWLLANRPLLREQDLGANRGVRLSDIMGNAPFNERRRGDQTLPPLLAERDASGQLITQERVVTVEQLLEVNARTGQHAFAGHCSFPNGDDPYPRFGVRRGVMVTLANIAENLPNGCEYRGGISMINGQWVYLPHAGGLTIPQQLDQLVEQRRQTLANQGVVPVAQILADRRQVAIWRAQPDVVFTATQTAAFEQVVDTALERLPANPQPVQQGSNGTQPQPVVQSDQARRNAEMVNCLTTQYINTPACAATRARVTSLNIQTPSETRSAQSGTSANSSRFWPWILLTVLLTTALIAFLLWAFGFIKKYRENRDFKTAHEPLLKVVARNFFGSTPEEIKAQVEELFSIYTKGMNAHTATPTEKTGSLFHLTPAALAVLIEARQQAQDELRRYDAAWTATEEPAHRYGSLNPQTFSQALADALKPPLAAQAAPPANNAEVEALQEQLGACQNELAKRDGALLGMRFKCGELSEKLEQRGAALREQATIFTEFTVKVGVYQQQLTHLLGALLVGLQVRNERDLALFDGREAKLMQDCFNREYAQLYAAALAILSSYRLHLKDLPTVHQEAGTPAVLAETDPRVEVVVAWFEAVLQAAQDQPSVALDAAIRASHGSAASATPVVNGGPSSAVASPVQEGEDSWGALNGAAPSRTRDTFQAFGPLSSTDSGDSSAVPVIPKGPGVPVFGGEKDKSEDTQPFVRVPDGIRVAAADQAKVNGKAAGNGLNGHGAHVQPPPPDGLPNGVGTPLKKRPAKASQTPSRS